MNCKIDNVKVLSVGTAAQDVKVNYRGFLLQNRSESATVYFREKDADGTDCSALNGFAVGPGVTLDRVYTAHTLSLVASAAGTDVRLLLVDIG